MDGCGVKVYYSPNDGCYVAQIVEFVGCAVDGPTPEMALARLHEAKTDWIRIVRENNHPTPAAALWAVAHGARRRGVSCAVAQWEDKEEGHFMREITQQWVDKAEGDWLFAGRAVRVQEDPVYDHVCFHSYEDAEKYLKARLVEAEILFLKTHNLPHLLTLLLPIQPDWQALEADLLGLKAFGVSIVYPGKDANQADAQAALCYCRSVREAMRRSLELAV